MTGSMKRRVTLQGRVRSSDGGGGFTETWQNLASVPEVYASIEPLSGAEQLRYHKLSTVVTHRITIRYRSDVTPDMRMTGSGKVYDIVAAIDRGGEGLWLDILATAAVS